MILRGSAIALLGLLIAAPTVHAQSSAINATIEGTVRDATGALIPGTSVVVTSIDTGAEFTRTTDANGNYKALSLPLGAYRVSAALTGFKTVQREGLSLSAGQTAVVDFSLEVGGVEEVVNVTAETAIADPARINIGRTINEDDVRNLPLVARNPYNFALIQPNVTGYENVEFGATRMNANGSQMRTNYQMDGSNATQKDRAGLRAFQPSEVMVKEIKVITSGFAPEFGNTTGMVFNMITPSGSNSIKGSVGYRYRRKGLSARPFGLSETADKPDTNVDNFTATFGGPLQKDKWHYYLGYERLRRDLSQANLSTIDPADAAALNLTPDQLRDGVRIATANMIFGRLDGQLSPNHRLSVRYGIFLQSIPNTGGSGTGTSEVTLNFEDRMDTGSVQLVSNFGNNKLNELRIGWNRRDNPRTYETNTSNVFGPEVSIPGVVTLGGADRTASEFVEETFQFYDSLTWISGRHTFKIGGDVQLIRHLETSSVLPEYTFDTIGDYQAALAGAPFSWSAFEQRIGDPTTEYKMKQISFFAQDDFRVSSNFKIIYGLRYDLGVPPDGLADAPHPFTRSFNTDGNNIAPRVGFAWSLDESGQTVLRASTGLMYELPLGRNYEDALTAPGTAKFINATLRPGDDGAPAFPGGINDLPAGEVPPQPSVETVSPDYVAQYALLSNVQLERALNDDLAVSVAFVNSTGRNLPLAVSVNYALSGDTLPDGRPIYDRSSSLREFPNLNRVKEQRSEGDSQYNAVTVQLNKRMSKGFQAQASYTWASAKDHPLGGGFVVGGRDAEGLSDPTNPDRDYGFTSWNTTHTFIASTVIRPESDNPILNDNQLGLIVQLNSGLPVTFRSNRDLNNDGLRNDRPNDVARNFESMGRVFNVDARYSRFIPLGDRFRAELFVEAKNIFNTESTSRVVEDTTRTDTQGNPDNPISSILTPDRWYQQRQFQLAVKFHF